jgi:hypothetical protein
MRHLAQALVVAVGALVAVSPAAADVSQRQELAERYAPVVRLVERTDCLPGKAYEPIDVDLLFGEPTVALRGPWGNDLVKIGPEAKNLVAGSATVRGRRRPTVEGQALTASPSTD